MEQYVFEKSTCEKYTLRWNHGGWAVFTIDENGLFNCQSDYGDYQYMWPRHGRKSFKHFILELARDSHYLLRKVAKDDYFYEDETLEKWKQAIITERKENNITKNQARDLWDEINQIDLSNSYSAQQGIYESRLINEIYEEPWYVFEVVTGYEPQARYFAKEIMPMFAEILRKEIEECEGDLNDNTRQNNPNNL